MGPHVHGPTCNHNHQQQGNKRVAITYLIVSVLLIYGLYFISTELFSTLTSSSLQTKHETSLPSLQAQQRLIADVSDLREAYKLADFSLKEAKVIRENAMLRDEFYSKRIQVQGEQQQLSSGSASSSPPPPPPVQQVQQQAQQLSSSSSSSDKLYINYLSSALPSSHTPKPKITVLLGNKFRGYVDWWREEDFLKPAKTECSTECIFTEDNGKFSEADAVLYHTKTHSMNGFPKSGRGKESQKWVMVSLEQEDYAPLMKDKRYVEKFDWTATYSLDSDIPLTTIHPQYSAVDYHAAISLSFTEKDGFGFPDAIAVFVSNCNAAGANKRLDMLTELAKHMTVHSYGGCMKNMEEPKIPEANGNRNLNKRLILQRYKFYLAFENNQIQDYVSEKVFDGLLAGTLPVYWGAESIEKFMPVETKPSIVKMGDYKDMLSLAVKLKSLANDEIEYNKFFEWKEMAASERFQSIIDMTAYKFTSLCRFCQKIAEAKGVSLL